ncbi:hypothetical protein [uncultured Acetobacteroides sp.]|uniref:hypothetical protein n=1 Tax=uncultured Acetobacteroides sp. TaxID=1760811 RepID=UPI0029F52E7D|nr:hypothetical protein [uncultured Acetobacteroides sp.]
MDERTFIKLIENPLGVDDKALDQLVKVIEKYPYFSLAKLAYLKGLKVNGDARFSTLLSHVSTYAPSGEWLYLYLNDFGIGIQPAYDDQEDEDEQIDAAIIQQPVASQPSAVTPEIEEAPANGVEIEEELAQEHLASAALVEEGIVAEDEEEVQVPAQSAVIVEEVAAQEVSMVAEPIVEIPPMPESVDEKPQELLQPVTIVEEVAAQEVPIVAEPIVEVPITPEFDDEEPFELIDDALESDRDDPIFEVLDQKLYTLDDNEKILEVQNSLIDQFLNENPRIVPKPDLPPVNEDISVRSLKDDGDLVTESLAKIYAAQGLTDKAADIYRKLCLKFPEKKAYFVAQLEKLKESK